MRGLYYCVDGLVATLRKKIEEVEQENRTLRSQHESIGVELKRRESLIAESAQTEQQKTSIELDRMKREMDALSHRRNTDKVHLTFFQILTLLSKHWMLQ